MENLNYYFDLMKLSYEDAVEFLYEKHGKVECDYFGQESYSNYLDGKNKKPTHTTNPKASEGLYRHHIDEIVIQNLSSFSISKKGNLPFKHHQSDRLVYCNLFEHAILHSLISKETYGEFGKKGLDKYMRIKIIEWYVCEVGFPETERAFFERADLESTDDSAILLQEIINLSEDYQHYEEIHGV